MGIVIRQSVKTKVITYLALVFGHINTLFLFPLVLSHEEIGLIRVLRNLSALFAVVWSNIDGISNLLLLI